jgi:hypothetical protein
LRTRTDPGKSCRCDHDEGRRSITKYNQCDSGYCDRPDADRKGKAMPLIDPLDGRASQQDYRASEPSGQRRRD